LLDCVLEQYDSLIDLFQAKTDEVEVMNKKLHALQINMKKLQADKAELLQLVNILSSTPMATKNVLESYFFKLAGW
jgi:hypothetical protein